MIEHRSLGARILLKQPHRKVYGNSARQPRFGG